MELVTILILAVTVEALIEYAKLIVVEKAVNWKQIAALVLGIGLSLLAGTDLYAVVGVAFALPYVGIVLTGIIFSRGANYVSDFIKRLQGAEKTYINTDDNTKEFNGAKSGGLENDGE